jgi:hypothetical protein
MATNDMNQAEATYSGFTALVKWGTISAAIVTVLVMLIIAT